tara:strand:- start:423 stop:584 length:162 start_codon:yes stop_codon:yes gene_type:complete
MTEQTDIEDFIPTQDPRDKETMARRSLIVGFPVQDPRNTAKQVEANDNEGARD